MKNVTRLLIITMISSLLMSCSIEKEFDPLVNIDRKRLNNQIRLSAHQNLNSFDRYDLFVINISNTTKDFINISYRHGIRLFYNLNGSWIEVEKQKVLREADEIIIMPDDEWYAGIRGDFPESEEPILVRIYIIGWMENSKEEVGGYLDLTMK